MAMFLICFRRESGSAGTGSLEILVAKEVLLRRSFVILFLVVRKNIRIGQLYGNVDLIEMFGGSILTPQLFTLTGYVLTLKLSG